jgi:uncharacterized repeat protein (TIGR01451 family)
MVSAFAAAPVRANTCAPAATRGTAPSDYQDYCWLDFTGYSDSAARSTGQNFSYSLPDGSTLSLTLQVSSTTTGTAIVPSAVPSWSGAAFGNSGFIGIPGRPVLYEGTNGSTVQVTLNNIAITPPPGSNAASVYAIVAADGESTNGGETLSFTTNGTAWTELAAISNGTVFPTLGGVGTNTVTETGADGTVGAYAFSSLGNPTKISSTLVGSGLQGAIFALRYASISLTAQLSGARANASDQFTYGLATTGGTVLASGTSTGTATGPFPAASLPLLAATYPFVVSETMASGSASTLANYGVSLTCKNASTGSSTSLPTGLAASTYTFPALNYGDAVTCVFTDTANRANLGVTKTGPASVAGGASLSYTLAVSNQGPSDASGSVVKDPAVANFTAATVTCSAASGGAVCPVAAATTVANLQGTGITIPTLPSGGSLSIVVAGTAGGSNISNTASVAPPATVVNSNATPTSTVTTTVTAAADVATTLSFPASVNAGQTVTGTVLYANNGPSVAAGVTYSLTLPANLSGAPVLTGLPNGAAYSYAATTGVVAFTGMPATLASGASAGPVTVSYLQPAAGSSVVTASMATTTTDPNLANNAATATIAGNPEADLQVSLSFPASVVAGGTVAGNVLYTNNGPSTATAPSFSLTLPSNLGAAPTLGGLPTGAAYSYAASTGIVTLTGMPATLATATSVGPISVTYVQPGAATSMVTAGVTATTADPNSANNTASATIGGTAEADLATTLSFPASVNAGAAVTGSVLYANNGPSAASGVAYTLALPANLAVAPTLSGLPSGATYGYVASTGAVTLAGMPATLAAAATAGPITVSYAQPGAATSTVTAGVAATTADPNPANNTAAATIGGTAEADLAITMSFPATVNAGGTVTGTVQLTNNGPSAASGVAYTLTLPPNLAAPPVLGGLPTGATYSYTASTGVVTFTGLPTTVASGTTGSITVSYKQPATGTSTVSASTIATTNDPNPANNSVSATINGTAEADLATTLSFPASVNAGATVTGTVLYTNNGPSMASGVAYTLTLPANLAVAPSLSGLPTGAGYSYTASTGVVALVGLPATLASAATAGPITVSYVQPGTASSTITAGVSATTNDPNLANNSATAAIGGAAEADLATSLSFPTGVNAGATVTGTLLYTNNGPSPANGIVYSLTLPANLAASPTLSGLATGATYGYTASTGVVTLTGLAATLASGTTVGPISVSYVQPGTATSTVTAGVTATTNDPNPANNIATVAISGSTEADLATALSFPAAVNAGATVTGTVLYTNNGPSLASGVTYALTLPANLSVAPTLSGLSPGASYAYAANTGIVTLTGLPATLASGATVGPISASYVQPGAATSTVSASVTATTNDPNRGNNSASATIGGAAQADLATSLSLPVSVNAGLGVTGTVLYTNNGPSMASGIAFTLTLPANLSVAPTISGLPTGASYSYAPGTGIVSLLAVPTTLAAGATLGPLTFRYLQPGSATSTVSAGVTATTADPNSLNNTASATIGGAAEADLATSLSFPATVNAGLGVTGTVLYTNVGPSTASGIAYTLTLPANLSAAPTLSGLPNGATYSYAANNGVITLNGMPTMLASGASSGVITVSYTQPGIATSSVAAGITATTADPNSLNNTASATIGGAAEADLATSLSFPATVNAGLNVTGTVLYSNNGPSTSSNVAYTLTLPANLSVAPTLSGLPVGAAYSYATGSGVITFTGMPTTLAAGAAVGPIGVSYVQPGAATSSVSAAITETTNDPNPGNNGATTTIGGAAEADLSTVLHFPTSVNAGLPVSGTITYTNTGPSAATGLSYSVTLPANLATPPTLSGLPAGAGYVYAASNGMVTLTGMPATLAAAAALSPITVAYAQPPSGNSAVSAAVASLTADPNATNNAATATIAGAAVADVAVSLSFPANVNAGQTVTGTVMFTNNGPSPAAGVTLSLTLPSNLSLPPQPSLPAGVTYVYAPSTGVVTLNGTPTTLASGASFGPIAVSYIQPGSAASAVSVSIASTTLDPNTVNNAASATITGAAEADLATSLHFPANVNAGATVTGTVTYTNDGPSAASGLALSLTLPANLTAPPTLTGLPTGAAYTYVASTGVVTLTGLAPTLGSAASLGPMTVSYVQPGSGSSTVSAAATATTNDPQPGNNAVTANITGIPLADLSVALVFPSRVNAGQPVAGTVSFANHGPSPAVAVTYTLSLPALLDVPPTISGLPAGAAANYVAATGLVTLTGMPTSWTAGAGISPIAISYVQPATGNSTVSAGIAATTQDPNTANNTATVAITGAAAELQGTVYLDNNQDGVFDAGDMPLAGATVSLQQGARVVATVSTDATGYYSFAAEPAGSYTVAVTLASGNLAATPANVAVTLTGAAPLTVNFGEIPAAAVGALVLTKTTPLVNISAGQSVPYTITATNPKNTAVDTVTVTDLMPAGFRYRAGSGAINGKKQDPTVAGHTLTWTHVRVPAAGAMTFTLVLTAGAGVGSGEYVNQAMAYNGLTNSLISNIASATVRITGDPTFDCPDLIGKVFDDANANGREDPGEKGIAGVRLVTAQGLLITTDAEGRYHIACPITPDAEIGTNFIVKLDERTLPSGYRLTTDNPDTVRLTAGKVSKLNFGATIHHVIRIEIDAAAFADDGVLTAEVGQRIAAVIKPLVDQAAIVRLAYLANDEPDEIAEQRLKTARMAIEALATAGEGKDALRLEEEIVRRARAHGNAAGAQP